MKTSNTLQLRFSARHLVLGGLLAALLCLLPALTRAERAVQAWVQGYNGPGSGVDRATAIAVDRSNNVIVTGSSFDGEGYSDFVTIQYSSVGIPLWTNRYNGLGKSDDQAHAVAVDGSNNVIVTGDSWDGTNSDFITIKYSSAGVALWTNRYNGTGGGDDRALALAVDGSNNVIVTGSSVGSGSGADYATIAYSSLGVPLWTNRYNGPGNNWDEARAVAVDAGGNVFVTGGSAKGSYNDDFATIKYSSGGVPLWTNRYNGPGNGNDYAFAVAVDGSNNVIVTGQSWGSGSWEDYATIKYSGAGVSLWTNHYTGAGAGSDYATAVAVDGSNNVFVTGYGWVSGSGFDYATIKYSSTGGPLWTNRYSGPGNSDDRAYAVAVDKSNNVIVAGSGWNGTNLDFVTIQYSSAGLPLWTNRYGGPGNDDDYAFAVAVDGSNNVIVTGQSAGSEGNVDFLTIKYVSVPEPVLTNLSRTNGTFQLRVGEVLQPGTLVIEASTDLAGWAPVFTNTTPTNVLFYTDPDAGGYLWRFYRAFQFP